jgi:hypothetical protein
MRLPFTSDASDRNHLLIIKRYVKSGWFFLDVIATFPFYLVSTDSSNSPYGVLFKLLRMVRIPKILNLLDLNRFNKFTDAMVSG